MVLRQLSIIAKSLTNSTYPMPIYNGDDEEENSLPKTAIELKARFVDAHGFFIASPEYNSSFSPLLKNTLDWISRSHLPDEKPLAAYQGKVAGIAAASPGGLGGLRGLVPLRMLLGNLGVTVVPAQTAVTHSSSKLDSNGQFTDEAALGGLARTIESMIGLIKR